MAMLIKMNDNYNDNDDLKGHDDNDENYDKDKMMIGMIDNNDINANDDKNDKIATTRVLSKELNEIRIKSPLCPTPRVKIILKCINISIAIMIRNKKLRQIGQGVQELL